MNTPETNRRGVISGWVRHNDYCGGCDFVDLEFDTAGEDPVILVTASITNGQIGSVEIESRAGAPARI